MPFAVYVLGLAIFAMGTSEFMLAGLLPAMAHDLGVTVPDAGLLISAFAVGMVVGAPLLAALTLRWPRRRTLLAFLAIFIATHVVGALAPGYEVLFATRVVGAFVYAGFFGVAAATATSMVSPDVRARALAIVVGGITLSTVLGVPAGTLISQYADWRAAFWTVAALTAVAFAGILARVPAVRTDPQRPPRLRDELRAMANVRLWITYGAVSLSFSSMMASFSYLGALLEDTTGLSGGWVSAVLALFGLGSLIGITLGGRTADARPFTTFYVGMTGVVLTSAALALTASSPVAVIVLVLLMGVAGMATNPAVNVRVYALAGSAATLAGSVTVSAFNIGNTLAPWLAGLAISAGFGYPSVGWVGAAMALGALALGALAHALHRRTSATTSASARVPVATTR
ncbi:Cmx/CmrA family chloramphenicol efflux MFS transporter [Nonomuraea typhae]|uniref:Cmx/CmrA family chloramphenicol efflux MFS transporter n=1 Tax=Nonomuraea typhae TaxID=2603600 RepID=UPI0012F76DC4|nr:Cmx/CmrA family chloramphenicol efflux MFS transporter [Nonomuraea typhae]